MLRDRLVTAPSVILISQPQLVAAGIKQFAEEKGLLDLPKLFENTPIGRLLDHIDLDPQDQEHSDGEMLIEFAGRQCYRAWKSGRLNAPYVENILETKHGSVLAHGHFGFHISGISRSLSLELNRHGVGTDISQESQRFVDANDAMFVPPPALLDYWGDDYDCPSAQRWMRTRLAELEDYNAIQEELTARMKAEGDIKKRTLIAKRANEAARSTLPNAIETQGLWTFNYRTLRHIIPLRGAADADLEIRRFAAELAIQCKVMSPNVFQDIVIGDGDFRVPTVSCTYEKP